MADPLKELDRAAKSSSPRVQYWQKELDLARNRRKSFIQSAERIVKLYEGERKAENSFNILYSNTETLLPACYNQLPRPYVDRRFKDADPLGKQAALTMERILSSLEDTGDANYDSFGSLMEQAVLGALVPGEGLTRFRYDAKFEDTAAPVVDGESEGEDGGETGGAGEEEGDESGEEGEGTDVLTVPGQKVAYETICGQDIDYDSVLYGFARRWVDVPWVAFLHTMTREDAEKNFGKELAENLSYSAESTKSWKNEEEGTSEEFERGSQPVAYVWEIWNKQVRRVEFYAPSYSEGILKELDDPYGLAGFFPCPEPLKMLLKRSKLTGTAPYILYEEQAKELNRITRRINRVVEAMKVRGFYDNTMQGLGDLLKEDDNTFLPARNVSSLQDGKNLQNSLFMMPLGDLRVVLQELLKSREAIKQTIYEITGIADIMRGNTQASETATAQNIKNQWGTLKLKRMQRYVQEYVRSCLRIIGELAGTHFSVDTIAGITNLPYAKPQEVEQAKQILQKVQQMSLMVPPQVNPQTGQQMPGQLPPQAMQAVQQAQAVLAKPKWEDVVGLLRNDLLRTYRIDIETNSTISADTLEDKKDVTEAMTALGQMITSFGPAVAQGALPMAVLKSMLLSVIRRFSFGREVEDAVAAIPEQLPPQGPDPKQVAAQQQELEKGKQEIAQKEQKLKESEQALAMDQRRFDMDKQMAMKELANQQKLAAGTQDLEAQKQAMDIESMLAKHMQQVESALMKSEGRRQQADAKVKMESTGQVKNAQQTNQVLLKTLEGLSKALEALTKATMADRQVVLERDAAGRPIGAVARPVLQ
jgi:hypothetical protein